MAEAWADAHEGAGQHWTRYDAVHMTEQAATVAFHRTPRPGEPGRDDRLRVLHALTDAGLGSPLDMWDDDLVRLALHRRPRRWAGDVAQIRVHGRRPMRDRATGN